MFTKEFDYNLPKELIANIPCSPRDHSRLLYLRRDSGEISHKHFYDLPKLLRKGDVLVLNKSKVIPARILFGKYELLLLRQRNGGIWESIVRPGKAFKVGSKLQIGNDLAVSVLEVLPCGTRVLQFDGVLDLNKIGSAPFPPYIKGSKASLSDYQTVYAKDEGSVAAPTAGLHFTNDLLDFLKDVRGVQIEYLTLHVGLGTFRPVKTEKIEDHEMHSEFFSLSPGVASRLNSAKAEGRRIIATGTTSVRVLESCVENGKVVPKTCETDIFIYPGYKFKFVDGMITNFHLPESTLLMLVSAFAGKDLIFRAYNEAILKKYRFYSFGDAMLIL